MAARLGRYNLSELSPSRLLGALRARLREVPHSMVWNLAAQAGENRRRLSRYAGVHTGSRCFIVANGPSLRGINLESLSGEFSFGLNRIYLLFPDSTFRPTYFVAMNELILEQFAAEIRPLAMHKFINWNRRALFPGGDRRTLFLKSKMVVNDSFQEDITQPVVVGGTVTFVALQIAFYMGFSDVILLGLDHQYAETGTPSATESRTDEQDRSHFHPQYFPRGSRWQLPDLLRAETDFRLAETAFHSSGRRVRDATPGGLCPVFEKADLDAILREHRARR